METKSLLALDVGSKRIGVAKATLTARLPEALATVERTDKSMSELARLVTDNQSVAVIVGLPRNLSGQETAQSAEIRQFVMELQQHIHVPIHLQDETLSSRQAEEELTQRGVRYNKQDIDALAATIILEDYLDSHPEIGVMTK